MRKKILFLTLVGVLVGNVAYGAIEFGDNSYGTGVGSEVIDKTQDLVGDISLDTITASSSVETAKSIFSKAGEAFKELEGWLKDKAGIDILGLLKTLLTWFVVVVEWMINLIKLLIAKV